MKPIVTWILIADGAEARVYANEGPGKGLHPVDGLHFSQEHLQTRDIMADRPGRSISSAGSGGRSAMEYSCDRVKVRELRFVTDVEVVLELHFRYGWFERLIFSAAPTALGDIRPALSKELSRVVLAELPKDLTRVPVANLDSHFEDLLAV
jgi:protein required for attachment to host cells